MSAMATTATNKSTPSKQTPAKKETPSKIITLRLTPSALASALAKYSISSDSTPKPTPSAAPTISAPSPSVAPPDSAEKASSSNGTPMPAASIEGDANKGVGDTLAPPPKVDRRRRAGAAVGGRKRAPPSIDPNGPIRERGRPGPKKKPRLPDGSIDHSGSQNPDTALAAPNNPNSHHRKHPPGTTAAASRLGPKANTGNINANLRALDRTGKPCRKWNRQPLQLKSFTGVQWGMSKWSAPVKKTEEEGFPGDVKSDTTGSSEVNGVKSEQRSGDGDVIMRDDGSGVGMQSSPAPAVMA